MKKKTAPKKRITIENLSEMPYDKRGMHATGRRIYAPNALVGHATGWNEYVDQDGELVYAN